MKLADAAANYVAHKQSMGMRFRTEARTLKSFCHAVGDVTMQGVSVDKMAAFLAGTGPITRFWERKHSVLRGFYRFAIGRGYVDHSPLPRNVPRPLQAFEPYIYSREELHRLLDAVIANDHPRNHIDPGTYRVLLLLLYGAGLRISEALALTMADVDLAAGILGRKVCAALIAAWTSCSATSMFSSRLNCRVMTEAPKELLEVIWLRPGSSPN